MGHRLSDSLSPYLLQHADNPVDWWPWGPEALAEAKRLDRPIFLSVGYSSCHWCHVMAHESFEDEEVADALNRGFVSIKLDREERPDIDEIYMTAVQLATGHGGWPMSVFLTPDMKPFFAGTYFPKQGRQGMPGFVTIVENLAKAWVEQRDEIEKAAEEFAGTLNQVLQRSLPPTVVRLETRLIDGAARMLHEDFDYEHGGYGERPKFPPHSALAFLLHYAALRAHLPNDSGDGIPEAARQSLLTLEKMALSGLHDHVQGGFHRYSTDERWLLPHFEKMLYDNAQLLWAYGTAAQIAEDERLRSLFGRTAQGIRDWAVREMRSGDGLFYSALDADADGEEGSFTVWSCEEIRGVLGERAEAFLTAYQCAEEGNYLDEAARVLTGHNVLHLAEDQGGRFDEDLVLLRRAAGTRVRPGLDDKALACWNGLMIRGLAAIGEADLARACADRWLGAIAEQGRLPHMITRGVAGGEPLLDDVAAMALGLFDLAELTEEERYRTAGLELVEMMCREFGDPARGDFYFTTVDAERIFARTKPALDNATPSPVGLAVLALQAAGRWDEAGRALTANLGWIEKMPQATETLLLGVLQQLLENGEDLEEPVGGGVPMVSARLETEEIEVGDDGFGHTAVVVQIPEGWHINSATPPANWLVATTLRIDNVLGEAGFPGPEDDRYSGELRIPVRLVPRKTATEFQLRLRFQACTESECLAPQEIALAGVLNGKGE